MKRDLSSILVAALFVPAAAMAEPSVQVNNTTQRVCRDRLQQQLQRVDLGVRLRDGQLTLA